MFLDVDIKTTGERILQYAEQGRSNRIFMSSPEPPEKPEEPERHITYKFKQLVDSKKFEKAVKYLRKNKGKIEIENDFPNKFFMGRICSPEPIKKDLKLIRNILKPGMLSTPLDFKSLMRMPIALLISYQRKDMLDIIFKDERMRLFETEADSLIFISISKNLKIEFIEYLLCNTRIINPSDQAILWLVYEPGLEILKEFWKDPESMRQKLMSKNK